MTLAFVFPGQGSQSIGMLSALAQSSPLIESTFAQSSSVLGYDLWRRCVDGPAEALNETECTQPAMLTAGVATFRLWRERGGAMPTAMAGHSLGEFTALVAAGCLDFETAVDLVRFRAQAMQAAVPVGEGAMAAILGLDDAVVVEACAAVVDSGTHASGVAPVVEAVNFNAPGQVVIAGSSVGVKRAIEELNARGARRVMPLPVSVPAHSSLMRGAAEKLRLRLADAPISAAHGVAVYGVDQRIHDSPEAIREGLVKQLHTAVHWSATLRAMIEAGATRLLECGPGKVLTGLNRRIDKNRDLTMIALEDPQSLENALSCTATSC